jgi:hypothetical protein
MPISIGLDDGPDLGFRRIAARDGEIIDECGGVNRG